MAKRFRLIPFWCVPYFWGAPKEVRAIEKIKHYWTSPELEEKLLEAKYPTEKDKDCKAYKLEKLQHDLDRKTITQDEYDKHCYTLEGKPWFAILHGDYDDDGTGGGNIKFELDWNNEFVQTLRNYEWEGTDEEVVNSWFESVCRQTLYTDQGETFVRNGPVKRESLDDNHTKVT